MFDRESSLAKLTDDTGGADKMASADGNKVGAPRAQILFDAVSHAVVALMDKIVIDNLKVGVLAERLGHDALDSWGIAVLPGDDERVHFGLEHVHFSEGVLDEAFLIELGECSQQVDLFGGRFEVAGFAVGIEPVVKMRVETEFGLVAKARQLEGHGGHGHEPGLKIVELLDADAHCFQMIPELSVGFGGKGLVESVSAVGQAFLHELCLKGQVSGGADVSFEDGDVGGIESGVYGRMERIGSGRQQVDGAKKIDRGAVAASLPEQRLPGLGRV